MRTLFIAAGPIEWASARIRCYWPAAYMADTKVIPSDIYNRTRTLPEADNYIWQKQVDLEAVKQTDARHIYDTCDPMHWFSPMPMTQIFANMDLVIASNEGLASDLEGWHDNVLCIPDRLEPTHYPIKAAHWPKDVIRFVWFGIATNRVALHAGLAGLERLSANGYRIELTLVDERPSTVFGIAVGFPITYMKWELHTENELISRHDIALLPPYPGPWGKVKSDNKKLTAWACGLPVWDGMDYEEGKKLVEDAEYRIASIGEVPHVKESATEWEQLLI